MSKIFSFFVLVTLILFEFFISLLPFWLLNFIAKLSAFFLFDLCHLRQRIVFANLDLVFGQRKTRVEKKRIGRRSLQNFILTALEFIGSRRIFPLSTVSFKDESHLVNALAQGRGVLVMVLHLGNWELLCYSGSKAFCPVYVPVKRIGRGAIASWVSALRKRNGLNELFAPPPQQRHDKNFSRTSRILDALKNNNIVGFIVDQKHPGDKELPFFEKLASTNTGLAKIWLKHPCPVVPVLLHRTKERSHEMVFFEELQFVSLNESTTVEENILTNTILINKQAEKMIQMYPEEYFWLHNRWKF